VTAQVKTSRQALLRVKRRRHRLHVPPKPAASGGSVTLSAMTPLMVDRLFWRAGFGPTPEARATWTGKPVADAVEGILSTKHGAMVGPEPTIDNNPLDPIADDVDLVLNWVDVMIRTPAPFVERMTLFWHRHWATSRQDVSPPQLMLRQNALLRKYSDLATNADADFRTMAIELTEDPAMLRYLNGEQNSAGAPNENYGREVMELFALGVTGPTGLPNYSEDDVKQIAKALTGWVIDEGDPNQPVARFVQSRHQFGPKAVLGEIKRIETTQQVIDHLTKQAAHAPHLVQRLWHEFIVPAPDAATLADLSKSYVDSGFKLRPLMQKILTNPALFSSIDEPDMVKPPVIFLVGMYRSLGIGIVNRDAYDYLEDMGQLPYFPPTVAGWEYGPPFLNTNTALARFGAASKAVARATVEDAVETPQGAFERAWAAVGQPWLAETSRSGLVAYATGASLSTKQKRVARQLVLRSMILGGPDGQVM